MASTLYPIIVGLLFIFLIWTAILFYKNPSWAMAMLLPLLAWLIFDPLVLAIGNSLGEGSLLAVLTWLRYLFRVLAMPFLLIVAFDQLRRTKMTGTNDILVSLSVWVLVLVLAIYGTAKTFWGGLGFEFVELDGIKQYKEAEALSFPLTTILTYVILTVFGAGIFTKARTPWLLIGAIAMLIVWLAPASLLPAVAVPLVSTLLVFCFLMTELIVKKISPNPRQ